MKDTSSDIQRLYKESLLGRTGEERFMMGLSMNKSARAFVWASIPDDLPEGDRREIFFRRLYGNDFDERTILQIISRLRSHA